MCALRQMTAPSPKADVFVYYYPNCRILTLVAIALASRSLFMIV
jgi:hypothetical protein